MEQDKTIVFMEFATASQANIVKGALESNNIPCFISNENSPYPSAVFSSYAFNVRLNIFEKDKEKAEELMNLLSSAGDDDELLWDQSDNEELSD